MEKVRATCEEFPVKRLGVFGSALTENFSKESDVDLLVVFDREKITDTFSTYFILKTRLEDIFNRSVDLVVDKPFRNPYFQRVVDQTRVVLYER